MGPVLAGPLADDRGGSPLRDRVTERLTLRREVLRPMIPLPFPVPPSAGPPSRSSPRLEDCDFVNRGNKGGEGRPGYAGAGYCYAEGGGGGHEEEEEEGR